MINLIWLALLLIGGAVYTAKGSVSLITGSLFHSAEQAIAFGIRLAGIIAFWSGIMRIADQSGLNRTISRLVKPMLRRLFPDLKGNDEALGAIALSVSANMLGLANAGTAMGLRAMEVLQRDNARKERATNSMCTFVALTMGGLTIVPATVLALRSQAGSNSPERIILPTCLMSLLATAVALLVDKWYRTRFGSGRGPKS